MMALDILPRDKERYEENLGKIQEQRKKHRQNNIEKPVEKEISSITMAKNRQDSKEYKNTRCEKMKGYDRRYYIKNDKQEMVRGSILQFLHGTGGMGMCDTGGQGSEIPDKKTV